MGIFYLEEAKRESGLSAPELAQLEERVGREFEHDEMMFELHLSRALKALKESWVTLEEPLKVKRQDLAPGFVFQAASCSQPVVQVRCGLVQGGVSWESLTSRPR